jgi:type VI secretion system protein VasG
MSEISRAVLFGKLDTLLFSSLESATAFCKLRGNPYVELVHWLHALMQQDQGDLQQVIRHFSLSEEALTKDIVHALDSLPRGASSVSDLSEHIDNAVERAWVYGSLKFGVNRIRGGHLLIGLLKTWSLATVLKGISSQFERVRVDALLDDFDAIFADSKEAAQSVAVPENAAAAPARQGVWRSMGRISPHGRVTAKSTRWSGVMRRSARWWIS